MELSERCIQTLEKEGFLYVYECQDKPGELHPEHFYQGKVTIFITEGSLELTIAKHIHLLRPGDRFNIPPQTMHSATAGPHGCQYVVGEMVREDM